MKEKMKQTLMGKFTDLSNIMSDKVAAGSCDISQVATLVDSMIKIYKAVNEENGDREEEFIKSLKRYIKKQSAIQQENGGQALIDVDKLKKYV